MGQVYGRILISIIKRFYCHEQKMDLMTLFFFHKDKSVSTQQGLKKYRNIKQEKDKDGKLIHSKEYPKTWLSRVEAINNTNFER